MKREKIDIDKKFVDLWEKVESSQKENEEKLKGVASHSIEDSLALIILQEINKATDLAEEATTVKTKLPKFFNPLFRKQNVFNRKIILALREVLVANALLRKEVNELKSEVAENRRKLM